MKPAEPQIADPRRRALLAGGASVAAAAGLAVVGGNALAQAAAAAPAVSGAARPLPAYATWKDASNLIVHSANTVETKRGAFGTSVITPSENLYIRNNLPAPSEEIMKDPDAWEISVEGVKNPRKFSVAELKTMGLQTTAMVLQCSGNGRGYFPSKPSGTQWTVGAAGCVIWSGVPVRDVVKALGGVADGMVYMTSTGGEKIPEGLDPTTVMVERSVPLAAMEDALLAWELNGEPVPLAHGGPLRVVVPGFTGVNSVKYAKRLAFTKEQSPAKIQQTSYRFSKPGVGGKPGDPSIWEMAPKSWIDSPLPDDKNLRPGPVVITGVAMGGMHEVAKIEVSTDGGGTWQAARFVGPDLGRYAWRVFALETKLAAGTYTLASRATDSKGNVQPEQRIDNNRGYGNTSWADHAVKVTVA